MGQRLTSFEVETKARDIARRFKRCERWPDCACILQGWYVGRDADGFRVCGPRPQDLALSKAESSP